MTIFWGKKLYALLLKASSIPNGLIAVLKNYLFKNLIVELIFPKLHSDVWWDVFLYVTLFSFETSEQWTKPYCEWGKFISFENIFSFLWMGLSENQKMRQCKKFARSSEIYLPNITVFNSPYHLTKPAFTFLYW